MGNDINEPHYLRLRVPVIDHPTRNVRDKQLYYVKPRLVTETRP